MPVLANIPRDAGYLGPKLRPEYELYHPSGTGQTVPKKDI